MMILLLHTPWHMVEIVDNLLTVPKTKTLNTSNNDENRHCRIQRPRVLDRTLLVQ